MADILLNRLSRWTLFSDDEVAAVRNLQGESITVERGDLLPMDVDAGSAVIMLDCWAARAKDAPNGRRIITEFMLPGELMLAGAFHARSAQTVILSRGRVLVAPAASMRTLSANPNIGEALDWLFAIRESINREAVVNISARKAHQRLAHLLCELSARVNGAGLLQGDTLEMPLTQIDLAAALAMSTVHLNIALQRLRSAGLVELKDKHLVIRDRARLDAIAGFDDGYLLQWPTRIPDRRNMLSDGRADGERRRRQNRMID